MISNFNQICQLAAIEHLKMRRSHCFSVAFDPILFKLAGNEDMNCKLNEFGFRSDQPTDFYVN